MLERACTASPAASIAETACASSAGPPTPPCVKFVPSAMNALTDCDMSLLDRLIHPDERVALFIDGANLYSATRTLAFDIDYRKLLDAFHEHGRFIRAYYYTALVDDQEFSPLRPLIDWLDYNGYAMVT